MDIRIVQRGDEFEAVTLDWLLTSAGQLDTGQELATAVIVALCTDRRALPDDTLPNPDSDDRRGWWADTDADLIWAGWPIGSRLWLLSREKITGPAARQGDLMARIESYMHEAIQPFIDIGVATAKEIEVSRLGLERIDATVTLYRGDRDEVALRFQSVWTQLIGGSA